MRPGVRRSVDCEYFRLEHLEPTPLLAIDVPASAPHCLHALAGRVDVQRSRRRELGTLERGESALVPRRSARIASSPTASRPRSSKWTLPPYVD